MKAELTAFSGAFIELGINFDVVIESEAFFSIDTLINTISIFEAQGVDISAGDFVQERIQRVIVPVVVNYCYLQVVSKLQRHELKKIR